MEFWGLEVKPNHSIKVSPDDDHFLHLSQGALGEVKKDDKATVFVKVDGQKLAIGTLSTDKFPQIQFNLVFEKEFELSHNSKISSVFFSGYKVFQPAEGDEVDFDSEEEEEKIIPAVTKENGKLEANEQKKQVKIDTAPSKSKAAAKDVGKSNKDDASDDDEDENDDDNSEDDSTDGALIPVEDDSEESLMCDNDSSDSSGDDDEESDDEEEETPKKQETENKRAAGSVLKTPVADKKDKIATPSGQKTGDKKGAVHLATPHPAKKAGKTPAKSPKSGGSVACKSCTKTFKSKIALQCHSKAKHAAK